MNKNIMRKAVFGKEVNLVENGQCPFCEKKIILADFDELSFKEYLTSGLCQVCQDKTF